MKDLSVNKIKNAKRHEAIFEAYNISTTKPIFLHYNSKFNVIKTEEDLQNIEDYLRNMRTTTLYKLTRLPRPFVVFQQMDE